MAEHVLVQAKNSTNVRFNSQALGWLALRGAVRTAPGIAMPFVLRRFFTPSRRRASASFERFLPEPFALDGLKLRAFSSEEARPKRVLLLHGWNGDVSQLLPIAHVLDAAGWQVTLIELPGHGASEGDEANAPMVAREIMAAVRQFGAFHAVVAHSLGCAAVGVALRLGLQAQKLVFIAPATDPVRYADAYFSALGLAGTALDRARAALDRHVNWHAEDLSLTEVPRALQPPLLVIHDQHDKQTPHGDSQRLIARWGAAQLHTTSGLGHARILADAKVAQRIAEFLV